MADPAAHRKHVEPAVDQRADMRVPQPMEAHAWELTQDHEAALTLAHYDQARTLARTVIGRYPNRELIDPEIFVVEMTRVFAEAPADLGQQAADDLRFLRFLPNVGDVKAALDPLVDERRAALNQARRHLAEHQRRKAETAKPKPETYQDLTPAERKAFDGEIQRVKRGGQPRPIAEVLGRCRK